VVDPLDLVWAPAYVGRYVHGSAMTFSTLAAAKVACLEAANVHACGGVVSRSNGTGVFELRVSDVCCVTYAVCRMLGRVTYAVCRMLGRVP
jgi:hypothetical protein